jgi:hypothetical protein
MCVFTIHSHNSSTPIAFTTSVHRSPPTHLGTFVTFLCTQQRPQHLCTHHLHHSSTQQSFITPLQNSHIHHILIISSSYPHHIQITSSSHSNADLIAPSLLLSSVVSMISHVLQILYLLPKDENTSDRGECRDKPVLGGGGGGETIVVSDERVQ